MTPDYTLIRSRRKTVALQITPKLELIVRAPQRMPKRDIERFVQANQAWIDVHTQRIRERMEAMPVLTEADIARLKAQAKAEIPGLVAHYAARMRLVPTGVKITSAKTRFGSCSGKNSLCFSYLLMQYPPQAVEYVVVHELAHIAHKNHSRTFYALIEQYLPDYRARRELLRMPVR